MEDRSKAFWLIIYSVFIAVVTTVQLRRGSMPKRYGGSFSREDNPRSFWLSIGLCFVIALCTLGYAIRILISNPH
jgi:hypothetical protein